ncbi:MAG: phosphopyruvate hydratase, partial [Gammaproteobacteria bacterium]|nr:phosphopyruvate hydratase [Gammaproteobacteria bacterium]
MDSTDQAAIDARLIAADGTPLRERLGGNTLIATSMAVANLHAAVANLPLYRVLADTRTPAALPVPEIQIMGGGAHAHGRIDLQDMMVVPVGAVDWPTALHWCADVYRAMGTLLSESGRLGGVADEGGYYPQVAGNEEALALLTRAIERSGHRAGVDVVISIDVAASQFVRQGKYRVAGQASDLDAGTWIELLVSWCKRYPIRLVEDPADEHDAAAYARFRQLAPGC